MVKVSDLPLYDANGKQIQLGDIVYHGMRRGDPRGWTIVRVVLSHGKTEWLGEDLNTGEREELAGISELLGFIERPGGEGEEEAK